MTGQARPLAVCLCRRSGRAVWGAPGAQLLPRPGARDSQVPGAGAAWVCPLADPRGQRSLPAPGLSAPGCAAPPAAKWLTPDALSTPALQPQPRCRPDQRSPGQVAGPGPRGGPRRRGSLCPRSGLPAPGTRCLRGERGGAGAAAGAAGVSGAGAGGSRGRGWCPSMELGWERALGSSGAAPGGKHGPWAGAAGREGWGGHSPHEVPRCRGQRGTEGTGTGHGGHCQAPALVGGGMQGTAVPGKDAPGTHSHPLRTFRVLSAFKSQMCPVGSQPPIVLRGRQFRSSSASEPFAPIFEALLPVHEGCCK